MSFKVPEKNRIISGAFGTNAIDGNNGMFEFETKRGRLRCIASDGLGWEHVSVSMFDRCPTWEEMCFIKDKFWGEDDCVMQLHPPKSDYVNNHRYCLHLWRPNGEGLESATIPRPPRHLVGV